MALKNVNIPLNIQDYPENSSSNISKVSYLSEWDSDNNVGLNTNGLLIIGKNNSAGWTTNSLIIGNNNSSSSTLNANINSNYIMVGNNLLTNSLPEHDNTIQNGIILGQYNNPIESPKLVIGNGTAEEERSNIVEVTTNSINLTPAGGVSFNMNSSGSTLTGPLTVDTIQGNSISLRGDLRVNDIYENESTENINFRNNAVFHNEVTFNDNINLQNNTISGGAILTGTYTFTQTPASSKVVLPSESYMITESGDNKIMTANTVATSTMSIHHIFMREIQFDDDKQVYLDDNKYLYMQLHLKSKTSIINTNSNLFSFNLGALKNALGTLGLGFCIPIYSIEVEDINSAPIVGSNISSISFVNSNWGYIGKITSGDPDFYLHLPITYASTLETRNAFNIKSFEGYYYIQ